MQQFTQKYTIVQLLEVIPEGTEYHAKDWPLHVTLADIFAIDWDESTIIEELTVLLKKRKPIIVHVGGEAYFGPDQQTHVVLLEMSEDLLRLHYDVISLLEKRAVTFNTPQFIKQGFVAHSTIRPHARLHKNDTVIINALSLVDMFPNKDPYKRKILKTIPFL